MTPSAHLDTFARDNLPPRTEWPDFEFSLPELNYPDRMNCVVELLDRRIAAGDGDRPCLISPGETISYRQLAERVNRIGNVLTRDLGLVPGNRVLLRGPNSAMMVAAYLAVIKAGGVVVATMPLLRAKEIAYPVAKAKIALALCDHRLADEMEKARAGASDLGRVVYWGGGAPEALEALMAKPGYESFTACDTASDDVCLIGFTSGTTGEPKGTMHFHRDILATCDSYGRHVLRAEPSDRFIGSPPLALMTKLIEELASGSGLRVGRMTLDILGAIPVVPVRVRAWVERPGSRISMMAAEMSAPRPDGAERTVARVTAWLLSTSDTRDAATDRYPPLAEGEAAPVPHGWVGAKGYLETVRWRRQPTAEGQSNVAWLSPMAHLVDSEDMTDLQRLAMVADSANGVGMALDPEKFVFMNTDTVVHLHRLPAGNDFALRARGSIGPDGIGVTTADIFDRQGFIGTSAQTLLVQRRT